LEQVEGALDHLGEAAPQLKKVVLNACAQSVAADGVIEEVEAELLRAIAETLDCPLPPFVQVDA
jgi:tellurite resistance protein